MPRRTTLRAGEAGVEMIEHVMAALAGMQVDNCEVWVDGAELPGCDGSALPFVTALERARIVEQEAPRELLTIRDSVRLVSDECWIEARPGPPGKTVIQYELDYGGGNPIGRQSLEILLTPRYFRLNLAASRTFVLEREAEARAGLRPGCADHLPRPADLRTPGTRSAMSCGFPTNASATRSWTWWATWPWPVATWRGGLRPIAAATA